MYVKLINEYNIERAPNLILDEEKAYGNPSEEVLIAHGYYPLVETECPTEEGYTYTFHYEIVNQTVLQVWDAHEIVVPEFEEEFIIPEEVVVEQPEVDDATESELVEEVEEVEEEPEQELATEEEKDESEE